MDLESVNWLLIRGLSREKRHWGSFPDLLVKEFPNAKIHFLDLAGAGAKNYRDSFSSIQAYTEDLRSEWLRLRQLESEKWVIASISMGAMIAMDWCHRYPQDFAAGILMNSTASNLSPFYHRLSPQAIKMITSLFFSDDYKRREKEILEFTTHMIDVSEDLVSRFALFSQESPMKRKNFIKQIYSAAKFKAPKSISSPLLFLAGEKDRLASYKCSEALADHYTSEFQLHKEAGHDLPLDDPKWVIEKTSSFLKSI